MIPDVPIDFRVRFSVDEVALSTLHEQAFAEPAEPPPAPSQPWGARLDRYSLTWVGAFDRDDLVGFVHACWDGGRHAFLLDPVVAPAHRHQGIGTRLVRLLVDQTARTGCHWLHVDYEPHLELFYQAAGFRTTQAGIIRLV